VNRKAFNNRPFHAGILHELPAFFDLAYRPNIAHRDLMQRSDYTTASCLPDIR
jgi:hypothetical protein